MYSLFILGLENMAQFLPKRYINKGDTYCKVHYVRLEFKIASYHNKIWASSHDGPVMKVWRKCAMSNFISDRGVCRTAPATPGLLNELNG